MVTGVGGVVAIMWPSSSTPVIDDAWVSGGNTKHHSAAEAPYFQSTCWLRTASGFRLRQTFAPRPEPRHGSPKLR